MTKLYARLVRVVAPLVPLAFIAGLLLLVLLPFTALAQDGGVAALPAVDPTNGAPLVLPTDPGDIGGWFKLIYMAIMGKQWWLLASLAVVLIVGGLRKWTPEKSKVGLWVRSKLGGVISNFLITLGSGLAMMLLAGQPFSMDLLFKALGVSLSASGGWAIFKNVREAIAEQKASKDGAEAAKDPGPTLNQ